MIAVFVKMCDCMLLGKKSMSGLIELSTKYKLLNLLQRADSAIIFNTCNFWRLSWLIRQHPMT